MTIRNALLDSYRAIHKSNGTPEWAWPVSPTIPFLGAEYEPTSGLLVYASAENLNDYGSDRHLIEGAKAQDRHRASFEEWSSARRSEKSQFPNVHINPVNKGGLLVVAAFLTEKLKGHKVSDPISLIETLSLANFGKYSRQGKTNMDYAEKVYYLKDSLEYVQADLRYLKPNIVVLPHRTWGRKRIRQSLEPFIQRQAKVVPVPQCFMRVIHSKRFRGYERAAIALKQKCSGAQWCSWIDELPSGIRTKFWRYLAVIDEASN